MLGLSLCLPQMAGRVRGATPPFDPLSLSPIALFDASAPGSLYQEATQNTFADQDGDPVGHVSDLGPLGHAVQQSSANRRPVYHTGNGLHWIEGDGADDMLIRSAIPLPSTVAICIGAEVTSVSGTSDTLFAVKAATGDFQFDAGSALGFEARFNSTDLGVSSTKSGAAHIGANVFTLLLDHAAGTVTLRVNGVQDWQANGYDGSLAVNPALHILTNRSTGSRIGAKLFAMAIWEDTNITRLQNIEQWIATRTGVSI